MNDLIIKRIDHSKFDLEWAKRGGVFVIKPKYMEINDETMRTMQGKAILSHNDHPDIRALFADFEIEEVDLEYTLAGGAKPSPTKELIIYSYKRDDEPAGLF